MKVDDIGSEFNQYDESTDSRFIEDLTKEEVLYVLSGRTALDFIVSDILERKSNIIAYLPSYLCETMILPFISDRIEIKYYSVRFSQGKFVYDIEKNEEYDVILILNYFGVNNHDTDCLINNIIDENIYVIQDITHSIFSNIPYSKRSNYIFASIRKWSGLACGAIVFSNGITYKTENPSSTLDEYIQLRENAYEKKNNFILGDINIAREDFLHLFLKAEDLLYSDYKMYGLPKSYISKIRNIDENLIRLRRTENYKYLFEKLKVVQEIEFIKLAPGDVPLFFPIIVNKDIRDNLQKHLIKNRIYAPIHWPVSDFHNMQIAHIYSEILSLPCDQRYTQFDMERIVEVVLEYFYKER